MRSAGGEGPRALSATAETAGAYRRSSRPTCTRRTSRSIACAGGCCSVNSPAPSSRDLLRNDDGGQQRATRVDRRRGKGRVRSLGHGDLRARGRYRDDGHRCIAVSRDGRSWSRRLHRCRRPRHHRKEGKNLELQALLERIRELDDIKTQFFANVSHEATDASDVDPRSSATPHGGRWRNDAGATSLERVLMNLLSNAFKFTAGRGKDRAGGTILCSLKADGERLTLSVEDSGPGSGPSFDVRFSSAFVRAMGARTVSLEEPVWASPLRRSSSRCIEARSMCSTQTWEGLFFRSCCPINVCLPAGSAVCSLRTRSAGPIY